MTSENVGGETNNRTKNRFKTEVTGETVVTLPQVDKRIQDLSLIHI